MATNRLKARLTVCVKTATEWAGYEVVPLKGEVCLESDTLKCKVGDGVSIYTDLYYMTVTPKMLTDILEAYAELESPAFTGTPTAPTAAEGTDNTQIATTAFVNKAVGTAVGNVVQIKYQKYDSLDKLPTEGAEGTIYMIPHTHSDGNDTFDEYMWFIDKYEKIGNTDVDLSGYQIKITGAATTILEANLTAKRVLISDENGKVGVSIVTSDELLHLSGVTSNIQKQLDDKATSEHTHTIGITGGATAAQVEVGEEAVNLNVTSVSTSVLNVPSGDTLVLDGNF